ncbi:MAG TPA: hypothetical protein VF510_16445 [Ktedonobacterales bacterium]
MPFADVSVTVTLNSVALLAITAAVVGLVTGQLMKSKGINILGDLFFGLVGGIVFIFGLGYLLHTEQYGFAGQVVLAVFGAIISVVILRFVASVRRNAKAA